MSGAARAWMMAMMLGLLACNGQTDDADTGRTPCENGCFEVELRPCRDNCPAECTNAEDMDRCLDVCQGDCIGEYDRCVADTCE